MQLLAGHRRCPRPQKRVYNQIPFVGTDLNESSDKPKWIFGFVQQLEVIQRLNAVGTINQVEPFRIWLKEFLIRFQQTLDLLPSEMIEFW